MRKYLILTVLVVIVVLGALFVSSRIKSQPTVITTSSYNPDWHFKCDEYIQKLPVSKGITYVNTVLNFSMYLPAGWTLADATDTDPHFYNCSTGNGLEIQGGFQQNPQDYYNIMTGNLQNDHDTKVVNKYVSLVQNAIVTEYTIINPESGEGWPKWFVIAYPHEIKAYNIGTFYEIDKYPFISTFKLLK